ncbi:hypothetical protein PLESTB_000832300 [Pleodorina starrii]|uniref:Uncharacterized protein n=1 Tax=Pleodorina starrii TaxID=330485 RepID=A0A9W6F3D1_9CHLO|nr:hypothetical protein PLESTM_000148200 [Pleodorina starrii]GLC54181.1 hypothetical protein PLESTB_000832300 [Pleodorina starrii]GLC64519.1 hypothetical protein PLESTF_000174700 [Pleodorina starrii]
MNEVDFRPATAGMEDTALWDVRRMALLAARRDDATPVRYFEDAVTEAMRSLHRLSQESLWDELQKHELGKRTLRALAAEYKPARMVAFEPDDLRRASVRFWEALRTEDEPLRDALAAYDYEAACGLLSKLSGTLDREVVQRLVYINCPRQNVVEEVVGTIQRCSTNELKMLASRLFDKLDKTGGLSAENREFAKKLPYCRTKEELRWAVRDLLQMFKRKPPPDEANPLSHIIGPSVATVTVSYKGQNRHVAAVVRIERLDDIEPEEPKVEPVPEPEPEVFPEPVPSSPTGSIANSVVTVNSDRTVPPSTTNNSPAKGGTEREILALPGSAPASVPASKPPSVRGAPSAKPTPPGSVLGASSATPASATTPSAKPSPPASVLAATGTVAPLPPLAPSPKLPPVSVTGVSTPVSGGGGGGVSPKPALSPKATPPGSVLGGGASVRGGAAASEPFSVRGSHTTPKASPPASVVGPAAAAAAAASEISSVRGATHTSRSTPPASALAGVSGRAGSDGGSSMTGHTRRTTPSGSTLGAVAGAVVEAVMGPGSDVGSSSSSSGGGGGKTTGLALRSTPSGSGYGGAAAAAALSSEVGSTRSGVTQKSTPPRPVFGAANAAATGPGSEVGSTRSGPTHKTTPAASVVGGGAAAASPGGYRSSGTTPAGSVVGGGYGAAEVVAGPGSEVGSTRSGPTHKTTPAGSVYGAVAAPRGSVPASVAGSAVGGGARSSGPASVKSMTSRGSSGESGQNGRSGPGSGANSSSQPGYCSISFDQTGLPVPSPKPLYLTPQLEEDQQADDERGSERSPSPSGSSGSSQRSARLPSRQPSRPASVAASHKSLPAAELTPRAASVLSNRSRGF